MSGSANDREGAKVVGTRLSNPMATSSGGTTRRRDRDRLIIKLYREGLPVEDIAARAGACCKTVGNVARRAELPLRRTSKPNRDRAALARYCAGHPVKDIAVDLQISKSRIRLIAAKAGIPPRSGWQRRYPIDETAFDEPTAVGWWLIGLLAADGSIHEAENRVSLCQTLDDADVLSAFYEYLGCPERPLVLLELSAEARARQYPRRPAAEARVFSRRIVKALARHGLVARKTSSLRLGREASGKAAVWLGLLDGDGSVGIYRRGRLPRLVFAGTRPVMEQCEAFWRAALRISQPHPTARPHSRGIWTFALHNAKAATAARILLSSSPTSLQRKRAVLSEIARWTQGGVLSDVPPTPKVYA
jgi:hypothetical protein